METPQTKPTPANCEACNAPLKWVQTRKGKMMPLDPTPVPNGNMDIAKDGIADWHKADPNVERYISHFATCPEAARFRKPK